jgi:hypothetical protein
MYQGKLESIIVSFGCLDLLSITLPLSLKELDHIIIVTKEEDKATIDYCLSLNSPIISIIRTDAFNYDGAVFNKGLAIALAMKHLKYSDWMITQDTDIIMPEGFREKFFSLPPNTEYFYGMRRINIDTREDYEAYLNGKKSLSEFVCYRGSGYGYWSCANYKSSIYQELLKKWNGLGYPYWVKEAREIDWLWRNNWGQRDFNPPFVRYPEDHFVENQDFDTGLYRELPFRCIHLGIAGKNHETRTTELF